MGSARLRAEQDFAIPRPRGGSRGRLGESRPTLRRRTRTPRPQVCTPRPRGARVPAPGTVHLRPRGQPVRSPLPWEARRDPGPSAPAGLPRSAAGFVPPPSPPPGCSGRPVRRSRLLTSLGSRGEGREGRGRGDAGPGRRAPGSGKWRHLVADASSSRCFKTSFKALSSPSSPSPGRPLPAGASRSGGTSRTTHECPLPRPLGPASTGPRTPPPTGLVPLSTPKAPPHRPERLGPAYRRPRLRDLDSAPYRLDPSSTPASRPRPMAREL